MAKLNAAGTDLLYFTTFGGTYGNGGYGRGGVGIAVDSLGNAYVVGFCQFPSLSGDPGQLPALRAPVRFASMFLAKLDPSGSRVSDNHAERPVEPLR